MSGISTVRGGVHGRVYGRVAGGTGTFVGRGATVVRSGAGVYVFTFASENQLDPTQTQWVATIQQAAVSSLVPRIDHSGDTTMTISTFDEAGVAADRDFKLHSVEFPPDAE